MHKLLIPTIFAICLFASTVAHASFGTGIGITFPASGSSTKAPSQTYAALHFEQLTEELTLQERHGRLLMELKTSNNSDTPYSISHRNGQIYDFLITDKNGKKYGNGQTTWPSPRHSAPPPLPRTALKSTLPNLTAKHTAK